MMRSRPLSLLVGTLFVLSFSAGCWRERAEHRRAERERRLEQRIAAEEGAIRAATADWSKAAQAKDVDKAISYYADTAILFSPKTPAAQGKENIRKGWEQVLALPGPGLSFTATGVEVTRSCDLAWEHGTYELATTDKKGKTTTEKGKYVVVWKKQADGAWKVVADIDNTDQ